jgi:predicted nucleic acid-binding protein
MITLDTSGIVALAATGDANHPEARAALEAVDDFTVVPAPILAEVTYMLDVRLGPRGVHAFLGGLTRGETLLDCADADLPRVLELMERYGDLGLGFPDASVIACAERNGGQVLTFDRRDFEVVAREMPITLLP